MGDYREYQPLTREDKVGVVIYRAGIALSALILAVAAVWLLWGDYRHDAAAGLKFNAAVVALYVSVGLSVFFIHLYVGSFHRALKRMYFVSVASLIILLVMGGGDVSEGLSNRPLGPLLLIPLSCCLGFITAKEAFCFRLIEGYILAVAMPLFLLLFGVGGLSVRGASSVLSVIAAMLVFFTLRKVFMPLHCDIGDKSAYS